LPVYPSLKTVDRVKRMTELSDQELLRYSRQLLLNEVDFSGQQKLKESHVIVMGVGGLGSLSAAYLVGAGIGKVTLVDDDLVELTNLHRQLIYNENDVGTLKVEAALKLTQFLNA